MTNMKIFCNTNSSKIVKLSSDDMPIGDVLFKISRIGEQVFLITANPDNYKDIKMSPIYEVRNSSVVNTGRFAIKSTGSTSSAGLSLSMSKSQQAFRFADGLTNPKFETSSKQGRVSAVLNLPKSNTSRLGTKSTGSSGFASRMAGTEFGFAPNAQSTWFSNSFGFIESRDYNENKERFRELHQNSSGKSLNGIDIGEFMLVNCNKLYDALLSKKQGVINVQNIVGDIKEIHLTCQPCSTIQVASQLNCLEMASPTAVPEDGITIYKSDKTQGPIAVMCTPAGIAFRNYLLEEGQTRDRQIDLSSDLLRYLKSKNSSINWSSINGYLMIGTNEMLKEINQTLLQDLQIRREARSIINAGVHFDLGVYDSSKQKQNGNRNSRQKHVNHVLCGGLPIAYQSRLDPILWRGMSELFLEAYYEITLLSACYYNIKNGINPPCYLTQVGGGVFGMEKRQIIRSIKRACNVVAKRGYSLDVRIVHYPNIDTDYESIEGIYPRGSTNNSIFNNETFVRNTNTSCNSASCAVSAVSSVGKANSSVGKASRSVGKVSSSVGKYNSTKINNVRNFMASANTNEKKFNIITNSGLTEIQKQTLFDELYGN